MTEEEVVRNSRQCGPDAHNTAAPSPVGGADPHHKTVWLVDPPSNWHNEFPVRWFGTEAAAKQYAATCPPHTRIVWPEAAPAPTVGDTVQQRSVTEPSEPALDAAGRLLNKLDADHITEVRAASWRIATALIARHLDRFAAERLAHLSGDQPK